MQIRAIFLNVALDTTAGLARRATSFIFRIFVVSFFPALFCPAVVHTEFIAGQLFYFPLSPRENNSWLLVPANSRPRSRADGTPVTESSGNGREREEKPIVKTAESRDSTRQRENRAVREARSTAINFLARGVRVPATIARNSRFFPSRASSDCNSTDSRAIGAFAPAIRALSSRGGRRTAPRSGMRVTRQKCAVPPWNVERICGIGAQNDDRKKKKKL